MTKLRITNDYINGKIAVITPYDKDFVAAIKKIGKGHGVEWTMYDGEKCWMLFDEHIDEVRALMRKVFGHDDTDEIWVEAIYVADNGDVFAKVQDGKAFRELSKEEAEELRKEAESMHESRSHMKKVKAIKKDVKGIPCIDYHRKRKDEFVATADIHVLEEPKMTGDFFYIKRESQSVNTKGAIEKTLFGEEL